MENEHVTINFEDFDLIQGNYDVENEDDSIDLEYLIETIRDLPILWNTFLRGYKETNRKNVAWKEVATILGKNGKSNVFL